MTAPLAMSDRVDKVGRLFGSEAQSSQLFIALLSDILGSQVRGLSELI